tara:strand:+ start:12975 stop:13178 length:204 start_codon:yes stop_codon:yes gene_type:complete
MNEHLLIYIGCGIILNFLIDLSVDTIVRSGIDEEENIRLPWGTKIFATILWPIVLIILVYKFFKPGE